MNNFTITAFADEIGPKFADQVRVLKEKGISHIEVRGIEGKNVSEFTLAEAENYKEMFDDAGIEVSSIGSPIGKVNIEDEFEEHLALFKHVLKIAQVFNSPYVRMFSFFISKDKDPDDYKAEVVRRWKEFLEAAKDYPEIKLLHENEKEIYGDTPERCLTLFKELNSLQVKAAFDAANFVQCGVEVIPHAYEMLEDYIEYVHIKDARYSDLKATPAGLGDGRVQEVLERLVAKDFKGFASIEPHLSIFDGFAELEQDSVSVTEEKSDGEKLFVVASNALKHILVDKMDQEWK